MSYARSILLLFVVALLSVRPASAGNFVEVPLNYNLDALYHGTGDTSYQSIADRGIVYNGSTFSNSNVSAHGVFDVTSTLTGLPYHFVSAVNTPDTVALTGRGGLPSGNYSSNTTTLSQGIVMNSNTAIGVLDNYSNGGGNFDMVLGFTNGHQVTVTMNAGDWTGNGTGSGNGPVAPTNGLATQALFAQAGFGNGAGYFDGVGGTDNPNQDQNVQLVQSTVTGSSLLSGQGINWNGWTLNSITFDNRTGGGGVGIYAVTVSTPEPSTLVLAVVALSLLGCWGRRAGAVRR
jgi:hypothetical protein